MTDVLCPHHQTSSPMGRREFLRAGSLAIPGLTLPQLLSMQAQAKTVHQPAGKAKACILLFMWGGPAQQDTWDPKPDAPVEYRGETKSIATTVPGLRVCEHLPRLASHAKKLAVIRSMTHDDVSHTSATHYLLTGRKTPRMGVLSEDWPTYGSVLAKLGRGSGALPPFVSMMPEVPNGAPRFVERSHGQGAGWLGPIYDPFRIDANASLPNYRVGEFALSADVPMERNERRKALLNAIENQARSMKQGLQQRAMSAHYERAFSLLSSRKVLEAFDLNREPDRVRERYGMNIHGQAVLQARRLVEAGVPLITVFWQNDGITNVSVYWDTHRRNFIDLKTRLCPVSDLATSALLEDLDQRGMLDETLVIWTGEMGRTPKVGQRVVGGAGAGKDGRDHWAKVFTSVLAGGGIKGGTIYGSSDKYAAEPSSNPTAPADLAATIYHLLGVDPHLQMRDRLNRPITICEGAPVEAIL